MKRLIFQILILIAITGIAHGDWRANLRSLLSTDDPAAQDALIASIVGSKVSHAEIAGAIRAIDFEPREIDSFELRIVKCIDNVERPWVLYIPRSYNPEQPTPLFVHLHGLVGRAEIIDKPLEAVRSWELTELARANGWIALYPFGQAGATWWDEVGMANIRDLVRKVKREFNVDDNRVYMGGFSDGGSASFARAMLDPSDFAAFFCLNGHMGVANLDGNLATYAPNMSNRPSYAVTTESDGLYPTSQMKPTIEMAIDAGANILYREQSGAHDLSYWPDEWPLISEFAHTHPRDPFPAKIVWECGDTEFGRCDWFIIDEITVAPREEWHVDNNIPMIDSSITVGFIPDYDFEGDGIMVSRVVGGETLANQIGLDSGDVIIRGDEMEIENIDYLNEWKGMVHRGDSVSLTVVRGGKKVVLHGRIPKPSKSLLFTRSVPSARVEVQAIGNDVFIRSSRLGAFRVLVHPALFNLDLPLTIHVNGDEVFSSKVEPNVRFMLENYLEQRDRERLYIAELSVEL